MQQFNDWTILGSLDEKDRFLCRCKCGLEKKVYWRNIERGISKSCGCQRRGIQKTHGFSNSKEFKLWKILRMRCRDKKRAPKYRNLKICKEWNLFLRFRLDMGERPSDNHMLKRKDSSKPYSKANCHWVEYKKPKVAEF